MVTSASGAKPPNELTNTVCSGSMRRKTSAADWAMRVAWAWELTGAGARLGCRANGTKKDTK